VADTTDEAQVAALFDDGPFDVVIANAGAGTAGSLRETTLADWNAMLAVNLTGTFLLFRAALGAGMGPGGRLIAMASTASLQGGPRLAGYAAAKHGVLGLVRSVALEVARAGITCNAICPGFVDTDMAAAAVQSVMAATGRSETEALARIVADNPMRRLIAPAEVTAVALFLASPGASMVNGHALSVSGGEV
jgi:NAD(P)-dependent dehydrogenase (short-subunit alcohol dehydrogenase family)